MKIAKEEYEGDYFKAEDIKGGRALRVEGVEKVNTEFGWKYQLSFHETKKKLTLNKTSLRVLIKLYGNDTDKWIGKAVDLTSAKVQTKDGLKNAVFVEELTNPPNELDEEDA